MKKFILVALSGLSLLFLGGNNSASANTLTLLPTTYNSPWGPYDCYANIIGALTDSSDSSWCKDRNHNIMDFIFDFTQIPVNATVNSLSYFIRANDPGSCPGGFIRPMRNRGAIDDGPMITDLTSTITNYTGAMTYDSSSTYGFKIYADGCGGFQYVYEYHLTLNYMTIPVVTISTSVLPDAAVGTPYLQAIGVSSGTPLFNWSVVSGSLPMGLSLNISTGEISGTPTTVETASFTVQVTDANNQTATKDFSITVRGNTPTGSNVTIGPISGATLSFTSVTQEGQTTVTTSTGGQPPPTGFKLGNPPTYYSISTTAQYTAPITVCISWQEGQFKNENNLKLFHLEGTNWVNITTSLDTVNDVICGQSSSFSDFAIFEKKQVVASIDIKPSSYPNSINLGSNGTVPVAIFSTPELDATIIDPLTVTLASAPVKLKGNGTAMYSFQDINNDGLLDLVVHVSAEALQLSETDEVANLIGYTSDLTEIIGNDTIRVVP